MTFLKNERNRLAFRFGRVSALRSTTSLVDQLQEQIQQLRAQLKQSAFNFAESEREKALIARELARRTVEAAQLRYELARRDSAAAFEGVPSPSPMKH